MSLYSEFFLNSKSNVVRLETIELSHPNFTKVYRLVRNAINGLQGVLLEDGVSFGDFDYYPMQIVPTASQDDLDQQLEIHFGDLGDVLPIELDAVLNAASIPAQVINHSSGSLPGLTYVVLVKITATGATKVSVEMASILSGESTYRLIINTPADGDTTKWRVYLGTVPGEEYVWYEFPIGATWTIGGVVTVDNLLGTVSGPNFALGERSGFGRPSDLFSHNGFLLKPALKYRCFRSDRLNQTDGGGNPLGVIDGPIIFEVQSCAFNQEGCTIRAGAPRFNLTSTGEIYTVDRFPMLRGFM